MGVLVTLALSEIRTLHCENIRPCLGCCASNGMLNFAKTFCFILQNRRKVKEPDGAPKSKTTVCGNDRAPSRISSAAATFSSSCSAKPEGRGRPRNPYLGMSKSPGCPSRSRKIKGKSYFCFCGILLSPFTERTTFFFIVLWDYQRTPN